MSKIRDEVLSANSKYTKDFGDKAKLPMPPGRRFAILTCPRCQGSCRLSEMESGIGWGRKVEYRDEALFSRT